MGYDFDNYLAEIPKNSLKHDAVITTNSNELSGFLSMGVADMSCLLYTSDAADE